MKRIGIIGVGEIGRALVEGLCDAAGPTPEVFLSPRGARTATELAERFDGVRICADNQQVVDHAELIIIAVRRQDRHEALNGLRVDGAKVVINVMPGVSNDNLRGTLATDAPLVRAIPLPSVRDRRSVTVTYPAHPAVDAFFEQLGGALPVADEAAFDVFSALTGTLTTHYAYLLMGRRTRHPRRRRGTLRTGPLPGRRPRPGRRDPLPATTRRRPRNPQGQQRTHPDHMVRPHQRRHPRRRAGRPPHRPAVPAGPQHRIRDRVRGSTLSRSAPAEPPPARNDQGRIVGQERSPLLKPYR
ncbi:NAD(P)-binding domain-containing protein [Streptomyces sp. NBC_00257]|uniref:NAD(P)-binding domain-containing protein n=1 Tax=unclassified Streptomyces TaxID=2593676 RepID=UPI00224FB223|nr:MULTISPECIES: NAD(P)-binding domain-containing protein [unclassified Streptomyces]MCX5429285.1 NAD(P)-binding domain-containing protein [Streptomyces sp. NBC_00062]